MGIQSNIDKNRIASLIDYILKRKHDLMRIADDSNSKMANLQRVYEGEASNSTVKSLGITSKEISEYVDAIILSLQKNADIQVADYQAQDRKIADSATIPTK